ncbi:hypothetical protein Tco_0762368 [Tanacetum coccineum]
MLIDIVFVVVEHDIGDDTISSGGMRHHHLHLYVLPAQSGGSSNTYLLDVACFASSLPERPKQTTNTLSISELDTNFIHIESRKSPTAVLFDDDTWKVCDHRRRPTLGLLILSSVLPFPPIIRRTARISIPPIKPNLAERARISAINLDDYQLDPLTPPPSPSSPFTMAAYQRMIDEMDPTQREEALTETGQNSVLVPETALTLCTTRLRGQLHTILKDMDHYPNACLEELEAFMTLWDVKPRVEESLLEALSIDELITQLRQLCEDAEDRASNA